MNMHQPVLLDEVVTALAIKSSGIYVDATFGRGGHSLAILEQLDAAGRLLVLDKDPEAIKYAKELFKLEPRVTIYHTNFSNLLQVLTQENLLGKVQGILCDLGVSSPQLDSAERGFSFMVAGNLDMRMNPHTGQSIADWLATVSERDLAHVIYTYGEEKFARRIAKKIVAARAVAPIGTTKQLANLILEIIPHRFGRKHPATLTFMALRIFINQELLELEKVMTQAVEALTSGGRLAIISFHSLEDRLVKHFMRAQANNTGNLPLKLPIKHFTVPQRLKIIDRPVRPMSKELNANPRSRSAILRVAEKQA